MTTTANVKRNVALLSLCQAFGNTWITAFIAVSALAGAMIAEDKTLATLPHAMMYVAVTAASWPVSMLMKRIGRRGGILLGGLIGIVGSLVCAIAILEGSLWWFVAGAMLSGCFYSVTNFFRFAAADAANPAFRAKAISLVIGGGVVAAFAGPELAKWTKGLIGPVEFAGTFFVLAAIPFLIGFVVLFTALPRQTIEEQTGTGRPLREIARQPAFTVAVLGGMISWSGMLIVMTATPLSMVACGHGFDDAAFVIQWHVFGMFAPSFFTGWIIGRFGVVNVMFAGIALYIGSALVAVSGLSVTHFWLAQLLMGVGWNFLFVGATELLSQCHTPSEKAKVQGFNDVMVFGSTAIGALASGVLQNAYGWNTVNYSIVPPILILTAAAVWLRRAPQAAA